MNYKFYGTVRLPRDVAEDRYSPKGIFIDRCITQILDAASRFGEDVIIHPELEGSNKLVILGNEKNAIVAKELIRATIIEIEAGTLDRIAMTEFIEAKFAEYAASPKESDNKAAKPFKQRVDLIKSPHDMNRTQFTSYERLRDLFDGLGIQINSVENKPTFIELSSCDGKSLKVAFKMAQWAVKEIKSEREISNNQMIQNFTAKSIETLGRERATPFIERALG